MPQINHKELKIITNDGFEGFICGTAQGGRLFNVMILVDREWVSRLYLCENITLAPGVYKTVSAPVLIRLGFTMDAYMRIYNRAMSHDTPPRVAVKCLRVLPYIRAKHRELYNRDIFYLGGNRHASAMGR